MLEEQWQHRVNSPEEMIALGKSVAQQLVVGDVLALRGGLGAGKTHFTKGVVAGLDCDAQVTSPTFSLVHEYGGGRLPLCHFDFYRMDSEQEVLRIGWDEYLDEAGLIVVEWPNKFSNLLPQHSIWLDFETLSGGDSEHGGRIVRRVEAPSDEG